MKVGDIITISRNRITGDRSYSHGLYQIVGQNNLHITVIPLTDRHPFWSHTHFISIDEHDFDIADLKMLPRHERVKALLYLNSDYLRDRLAA